jgi:transcriptional regulator with XRE-family HTH domain
VHHILLFLKWEIDDMNTEYEKRLGARIRQIREQRNLTQEQLSAKLQLCGCDITRSALAKIEVGQRHVYPDEIKLIKEILRVTFDELFPPI